MKKLCLSAIAFFALFSGRLCPTAVPCEMDPEDLLERTTRQVESFWEQVSSYACTESVIQEKLGGKGKSEYRQSSRYDYLALTRTVEDYVSIEEVRTSRQQNATGADKPPLLSTNGFPTLLLIFHPLYRSSFRFVVEPGRFDDKLQRVRFEHIPGTRSTSALILQKRIYPLELQGMAWIDPETGGIHKISARLAEPMKNLNIESFMIEVTYKPQNLSPEFQTRLLPSAAVVEVRTALQHWRNTHVYSNFKRFSVESAERVSK